MNTLILYCTRNGATQSIAEMLAARLPESATHNLAQHPLPSLSNWSGVILGSSLFAGQVGKELKSFVSACGEELLEKPLGLYLSGMDSSQTETYFAANFPRELLLHAKTTGFFGGVYDPVKCSWLSRLLIKKAAGLTKYTYTIREQEIRRFLTEFTLQAS